MKRFANFPKWKKIFLLIFFVVALLRISFIAYRGEIDKEYIVSTQYDLSEVSRVNCTNVQQTFICNSDRLNSLELIFDNIADDKAGEIIVQILKNEELIYQTKLTLANVNNLEWKKIFVNAEMQKDQEYTLALYPSENCNQVPDLLVVETEASAHEIIHSEVDGQKIDGNIVVNYGYLCMPGLLDKLSIISLWVISFILIIIILDKFEAIKLSINKGIEYLKLQVEPQVLLTILEIIGCFIIINCSGISFQAPTQVILYIISLIATINYEQKRHCINSMTPSGWQRNLLVVLYFYATFSLVGQRILIYPLTIKLTVAGLFVLICTFLWFIPVVNSAIYYVDNLKPTLFSLSKNRIKSWKFIILSIVMLIIPALYNLFANNPGITSPDTVACMINQAQHLQGSGDWHPAFYCMVLRCIQKVWDSTYAVILIQYFFWTYVCLEITLYLRKKGMNEIVLLLLTAFLGFNAGNYINLNTIWKDIPYTLSIFWSIIILTKLLIDYKVYKGKWYIYLELIIALVGISLYRKNGIVPFIIIIIFLIIILRKNIKVWMAVLISVLLFGIIKGPVYTKFEIQPVESGMYIGLSQDILGVYYAGGEVSENTLKMINVMTDNNNAEYDYTPTWSYQSYELNVEMKEFIVNYLDTFIKNPLIMSRAIIDREDAIWDIYTGEDSVLGCVNYHETIDHDPTWNTHYEKRRFVSLYNLAAAASDYTASSQWISAIEWRCGLFTLLGIIVTIYMFWNRKQWKYILLLAPSTGHILSLLLSTGWAEFRYVWPLNLLNTVLIFIVFVVTKEERFDV